jgi:hypothetical protein
MNSSREVALLLSVAFLGISASIWYNLHTVQNGTQEEERVQTAVKKTSAPGMHISKSMGGDKNSRRKVAKMEELQDGWTRCMHVVPKKGRYCNGARSGGSLYCHHHGGRSGTSPPPPSSCPIFHTPFTARAPFPSHTPAPKGTRHRKQKTVESDRNFDGIAKTFERNIYGGFKGRLRLDIVNEVCWLLPSFVLSACVSVLLVPPTFPV